MRDPRLHPVYPVPGTPVHRHRRRGQRRRVGPALRLGQAVGPEQFAAEHVRQPPVPLLVCAVHGQRQAGQRVHAHPEADREPRPGKFLDHLQVDLVRLAAAAPALWVGQAEQARPPQQAERLAGEGPGPLGRIDGRPQLLVGQLAGELQEFLHHATAVIVTIRRPPPRVPW